VSAETQEPVRGAREGKYILAHDVGTSGNKAALVDLRGRVVGKSIHPYETHYPKSDWAEQEPEDWWRAIAASTREVLERTGISGKDVACMTFSFQMLGIVPMSAEAKPLRPAIIWIDNRASEEARKVMRRLGGPKTFAMAAGAEISGKDGIPKLLWLKKHEPDVYSKMACFLDVGGYLIARSTGRMVMDWSGASAFGFKLKKKRWMSGMMRYFGIDPSKLPSLVRSIDVVGGLTAQAASECGLPEGTPVVAGAGDVPSASVGSGAVREGDGHLYLGTSGWVAVVTKSSPTGKHGIAVIQSADPSHNIILAEMETAGACVEWAAKELYGEVEKRDGRDAAFALMNADAAQAPAGSNYLLFTPWMYGERSPVHDEFVRSTFVNLSLDHTRAHMMRSVYEGVSYNVRWVTEILERDFGAKLPTLRVIGGGAKSRPWMQIMADVTQRRVETVQETQEAGAVGAALCAAVGLGLHPDFESLASAVKPAEVFQPSPDHVAVYDTLFAAYKETYARLKPLYHKLNSRRFEQA